MKKNRKFRSFAVAILLFAGIAHILHASENKPMCTPKDVVIPMDTITMNGDIPAECNNLAVRKMLLNFTPFTKREFVGREDWYTDITLVTEMDMDNCLRSVYTNAVKENVPAGNDNDRFSLTGIDMHEASGHIYAHTGIHFEKWWVLKSDYPCNCRIEWNWQGCDTCNEEIGRGKAFDTSVDLKTTISVLLPANDKPPPSERTTFTIDASTQFDDHGGITHGLLNAVVNFIGIKTLGIGSKFLHDTYNGFIEKFMAAPPRLTYPGLSADQSIAGYQASVQFLLNRLKYLPDSRFISPNGKFVLHLERRNDADKPISQLSACMLYKNLIGAAEREEQLNDRNETSSRQNTSIIVGKNDSLWKISIRLYGDGHYWHLLADINQKYIPNPNLIADGQTIKAPTLNEIKSGTIKLISPGDSLWQISSRELGKGYSYKKLLPRNPQFRKQPNRIYPKQVIVLE